MTDVRLGVTITGNASGLISEVKLTRNALQGLSKDAADNADAAAANAKAIDAFTNTLKRQQEGLVDLDKAQKDFTQAVDAAAAANAKALQSHVAVAEAADKNKSAHAGLATEIFKGVGTVEIVKRAWEGVKELYLEVRDATLELQQSQARLEAVLTSLGSKTDATLSAVNELADGMSRITKFDDTALRNAATTVLSFGNVSQEALEKILKASADLATTGRGDLEQWATVLAKVGTAPAETLGLLERQLGKIDIATKVAIISAAQLGDTAKANALLMDLVASRVSGAAVNSYKGLERQLDGTGKAWKRLKEAVGEEIFSAKSREASVFEQALDHMTETFRSRVQAMKDAWNGLDPRMIAFMFGIALPQERKAVPVTAEDLRSRIAAYEASIKGLPSDSPAAIRGNATLAQLRQQLYGMPGQIPTAGVPIDESAGLAMGRPFAPVGTRSMLTPQDQLELAQQQLQAQQQLADQSYQILQEQIQRELALNEKKHAAGLMSEREYYAQLADLQEQAETAEVQRLQEDIDTQRKIVANAQSQAGIAARGTDPSAYAAAEKAIAAAKDKQVELEGQLAAAVAKVGAARRIVNADEAAADKARADRVVAIRREFEDSDKALKDQTADMQLQYELLGKTQEQAALLANQHKLDVQQAAEELKIRRQIEDLQRDKGTDHSQEIDELTKRLKDLPDIYAKAAAAQAGFISKTIEDTNALNAAKDAASQFGQLMVDVFTTSGSAAQKFLNYLKNIAAQLISIFSQRYFLQMVAGVTGNSAIAAAAQGVGQGTAAGAISSFAGSALNTGAGYLLAGGGAGGFTGAFSAGYTANAAYLAGSAEMAPVYGTFAGEMGGAMAGIESALAAIPVWGWIALAVIAIGAYLAGKGGGPKQQGAFAGSYTDGRLTDTLNGQDITDIHGDNQLQGAAQQLTTATAVGFAMALRSLGGTPGTMQFGVGFSKDPQGDAPSFIHNTVRDAQGNVIYQHNVDDASRDDKEFEKQVQLEMSRAILAGLQNSDLEEGVKAILNMVVAKTATQEQISAVIALATEFKNLGDTIDVLSKGPLEAMRLQLGQMNQKVSDAQTAFANAVATKDPQQILSAEQTLKQAIVDRYNTEINMAMQLKHAIEDLKQAAYEFSISIDQKIIAAGGTANIAGDSLAYATSLRSSIGGDFDPAGQLQSVQHYVGAIDNWYQARRAEIERDLAEQQKQIQAVASAEMQNNNARIAAAQQELQLVQQWKSVLQSSTQMLDQMRFSGVNPMSAEQRLKLAQVDAEAAQKAYASASDANKAAAAQTYLQKLQVELGLAGEAYQRPSPEYQALYDQIFQEITKVQADAQGQASREEELTKQLVDLQSYGNEIAGAQAAALAQANGQLDELNGQYVDYLTWAKGEASRLYTMQEDAYKEQLSALGVVDGDIQLFIGQKQKEAVDLLTEIRNALLQAAGVTVPGSGTGTTGPYLLGSDDDTTPPPGGGTTGTPTPGGGATTPPAPKSYATVVLQVDSRVLGQVLVPHIDARMDQRAPVYKQILKIN